MPQRVPRLSTLIGAGAMCLTGLGVQGAAWAQTTAPQTAVPASPILSLDQDALFTRSQFGQALRKQLEAETATIEAESRRLDRELEAEERDLTAQRATMTPQDFAPLAEVFDSKVQKLRAEREAAANALREKEVAARQRFLQAATQVIGDFMVESGAVAIVDKAVIIVSLSSLDVTDAIIARLDLVLGDGTEAAPKP
jgi:Skp family chaperone for outer membrane proteins